MRSVLIHKNYMTGIIFLILLVISNIHLFQGTTPSTLIYNQKSVASGEWWRIITHLMVHVSWYHLLLDATAVAILWRELNIPSKIVKFGSATICAASSLIFAIWFSPLTSEIGYCGLSGMAHGLMFLLGLFWIHQALHTHLTQSAKRTKLWIGAILAAVASLKSGIEVLTGSILFSSIHTHNLGTPIVHAHLGGVIGGLLAFLFYLTIYTGRKKKHN